MCSTTPYDHEIPWKKEKPDVVQDFFANRAHYYDDQMAESEYNGPSIAAQMLSSLISDKSMRVLDVAAGTGLVGKALSKEGFTNLTALDRSEEMLRYSKAKNVYSELLCGAFEEMAKTIPDQSFHACVCIGAFMTAGFLDPSVSIAEMVRLVEKGGLILLLVNRTELTEPECMDVHTKLENACAEITRNGLCQCLQKTTVPKYLQECEGILWVFKKQQ